MKSEKTILRTLNEIAWDVSEKEYRQDPALSYSTLAKYEREGFNNLATLFDHISTPSLTLGSCVDTLITGGVDEFNELFYVADFKSMGDKERQIAEYLFQNYGSQYDSVDSIPMDYILAAANHIGYYPNWKADTRVRVIKEKCNALYNTLFFAGKKTVISTSVYDSALAMTKALKESISTSGYFADNNPDFPIQRYYQLKFKANFEDIDYRCMADLIITDEESKTIYPVDLKTSSHKEWDFQDSFLQWSYMIQSRLYWRIIRDNLDRDPYFKEWTLADYKFIVVNKDTLCPLVWEFPLTTSYGTLVDASGKEYRDPFVIGKELHAYLTDMPRVPVGISQYGVNTIDKLKIKS